MSTPESGRSRLAVAAFSNEVARQEVRLLFLKERNGSRALLEQQEQFLLAVEIVDDQEGLVELLKIHPERNCLFFIECKGTYFYLDNSTAAQAFLGLF